MAGDCKLLISLGAQKAGTTWLGQYLADHPAFAMPPIKEVHYFDDHDFGTVDRGRSGQQWQLKKVRSKLAADPVKGRSMLERKAQYLEARLREMDRPEPTVENYVSFMQAHTDTSRISCDITPANGCLSVDRLRALVDASVPTKFTLVLRDPVDRAWSAVRMTSAKGADTIEEFEKACLRTAASFLDGDMPVMQRWANYGSILANATTAIPADRLFLDFFEYFLSQPRIDAFCDFMQVARRPANFDAKAHVGKKMKIPVDVKSSFSARFQHEYDAVEAALGTLPDRWQQNRAAA